jgi:hypothetical protein
MKSSIDHLWYAWLYILGPKKLAAEYRCQIQVNNGQQESLTFNGQPHTLDKSGRQVLLGSKTLILTDSQVKNMFKGMTNDQKRPGEEDQLKYLIEIKYKVYKNDEK